MSRRDADAWRQGGVASDSSGPISGERQRTDVSIRPESPRDHAAVRAVHAAAFGHAAEADLVDALRDSPAWVPQFSLVAESDGGIVGHVLLTRVAIATGAGLALAPLGVLPHRQRRGVGSALVRAVLEAAATAGEPLVVVLGDPAYYGRFGFLPASRYGVTCAYDVSDEVFQALPLPTYSGAPRGLVRYPEPFSALDER
ncbi:MAG: GNAT family N-acetyltransferase [Egibacteraceae bacterium]